MGTWTINDKMLQVRLTLTAAEKALRKKQRNCACTELFLADFHMKQVEKAIASDPDFDTDIKSEIAKLRMRWWLLRLKLGVIGNLLYFFIDS